MHGLSRTEEATAADNHLASGLKIGYWFLGFMAPVVLFALGLAGYDFFAAAATFHDEYRGWIKGALYVASGLGFLDAWYLRQQERLLTEFNRPRSRYVLWGLVSWFFLAIGLFILLPLAIILYDLFSV